MAADPSTDVLGQRRAARADEASKAGCAICAMVTSEPRAGWVYEDESWVAGALDGLEIPGWVVLALRRHTVGAAPLSPPEAGRLGVAIGALSQALAEVTDAERVYLQAYGESQQHWHLLFSTRGPEVPAEHRHVAFFTHRDQYLDATAAANVLDLVRTRLRAGPEQRPDQQER